MILAGIITPDQVIPPTPLERAYIHGGWHADRSRIYTALLKVAGPGRCQRFRCCGSASYVWLRKSDSAISIRSSMCKDRFCLICGRSRGAEIRERLGKLISDRTVRFVTLTLRHSATPLSSQIDRIYRSFSFLRSTDWWRHNVVGGAAVLEVKIGKDGLWHVHLHMIVEGQWMDHKELSRHWHQATGDSHIVDIRAINQRAECAGYLVKYLAKPIHHEVITHNVMLEEAIVALHRRRMLVVYGAWHGNLTEDDSIWSAEDYVCLGTLDEIAARLRRNDAPKWWIRPLHDQCPRLCELAGVPSG